MSGDNSKSRIILAQQENRARNLKLGNTNFEHKKKTQGTTDKRQDRIRDTQDAIKQRTLSFYRVIYYIHILGATPTPPKAEPDVVAEIEAEAEAETVLEHDPEPEGPSPFPKSASPPPAATHSPTSNTESLPPPSNGNPNDPKEPSNSLPTSGTHSCKLERRVLMSSWVHGG